MNPGAPTPRDAGRTRDAPHPAGARRGRESPEASASRARAALAVALDPIITIDFQGRILSVSDSIERLLGWTPSELLGENVSTLMPEPHHSAHDGYLARYMRSGETTILNRPRRFRALHKDGSLVPVEIRVSRAELSNGQASLFVGILRDMSATAAAERDRDQERLAAAQHLAAQTSALARAHMRLRLSDRMASIGTLAAGLGHDMNNVLLPVRARLSALKSSAAKGLIPAADRAHIDEIRRSIAYLQQLADGLHVLALDPDVPIHGRAEDRATRLSEWWAEAGAIVSKAVPKHVRVSVSIPPGLPPVAIAPHALSQAVLNLVVNAGEAIPLPRGRAQKPGRVRIWADTLPEGTKTWVRLAVSDNGVGMSDEVKRRAFEMFFTTKPRGLGTGLGLPLVRKVVDRVGGRIELETRPGEGTTLAMLLPAASQPADTQAAPVVATITTADGRLRDIVEHLAHAAGLVMRDANDPGDSALWCAEASAITPARARAWRARSPQGRLVLVGPIAPRALKAWRALRPILIPDPNDYDALRAAVLSPSKNPGGPHARTNSTQG